MMVQKLNHPNLIEYCYFMHMCMKGYNEYQQTDKNKNQYKAIIIMEKLEGGSLKQLRKLQKISMDDVKNYGRQMLAGIKYLQT